jgi:hypothetical protein
VPRRFVNLTFRQIGTVSNQWCNDTPHNDIQHNKKMIGNNQHNDAQLNGTQYRLLVCWVSFRLSVKNRPFILSVAMLNVFNAECHDVVRCLREKVKYINHVWLCLGSSWVEHWQVDKVANWERNRLTKWQVDKLKGKKTASWQNGK